MCIRDSLWAERDRYLRLEAVGVGELFHEDLGGGPRAYEWVIDSVCYIQVNSHLLRSLFLLLLAKRYLLFWGYVTSWNCLFWSRLVWSVVMHFERLAHRLILKTSVHLALQETVVFKKIWAMSDLKSTYRMKQRGHLMAKWVLVIRMYH